MGKRISYSQFQSVKCVAKACDPLITKRNKLKEKIEKLAAEYKDCNTQINSLQAGIVTVVGCPVEQLVKKVIEPGVDVNGQPKKTTKYLPTDIVSYDEQHKQFVISLPDTETVNEKPNEEPKNEAEAPAQETTEAQPEGQNESTKEVSSEDAGEIPNDAPIFE